MAADMKIIYTYTDEAPALATHSLLPVLQAYADKAGVAVETRDISLAARILAAFDLAHDALAELGELAKTPEANIIKLPNVERLGAAAQGRDQGAPGGRARAAGLPGGPAHRRGEEGPRGVRPVKGSAVNPVLREGNSDRRAPASVKTYAQKHPHSMGAWSPDTRSHVATMTEGDFRHSETSTTVEAPTTLRIEHVGADGTTTVLKDGLTVQAGEIVDAAVMRRAALQSFLAAQVAEAKEQGVLFSVHLKATMMKVSDPIIFGHAVRAYFADVFERYARRPRLRRRRPQPGPRRRAVATSASCRRTSAPRSSRPSARPTPPARRWRRSTPPAASPTCTCRATSSSTPRCRRRSAASGQMWNADDELQDAKFVIPDSSYADLYRVTVEHCREHGAFDPTTMGTTPNVGLMAQKAEEYGSHDKTFEVAAPGTVRVVDEAGQVLLEQSVDTGDIFRACQTKDAPVRDWVQLAVRRARATGVPAVFWLDETRAHDAQVLAKVRAYLAEEDTDGLTIEVMDVAEATRYTLERARRGEDTISVTGNVLRDYLTDLFPILELGTSAKMLSIVPLMNGGGLFETGAGGSAPKHVQQLVKENYLRWDSLGEFLALAVSFEFLGEKTGNPRAALLGTTLDQATGAGARGGPLAGPPGRADRQPGQPLLPRAVLGAGARAAERGRRRRRSCSPPLAERLAADEEKIDAELLGGAGQPGRPRRLLLRRQGEDRRGDAPERDVQRGARLLLSPRPPTAAPLPGGAAVAADRLAVPCRGARVSKPVSASVDLPVDVETAWAALSGPSWPELMAARLGDDSRLVEHAPGPDGGARLVVSRRLPEGVPGYLAPLLPADRRMTQTDVWGPAAGGARRGTFDVSFPGSPGEISGEMLLDPVPGGTRWTVTGTVRVKVPLIGGKAEGFLAPLVEKLVRKQGEVLRASLA